MSSLFNRKRLLKDIASSGLKKGFIAQKAGIDRSYLYMVLKGLRIPSADVIKRVYMVINGTFVLGKAE